ncbi:P27 family phage terminase small subunit [Streptomyces sp. NPDC007063]|uniref:P27 family phage terminase small subunit n=1 Tax=Streptomyces sp. NPDC007063 TaxID=3364772 RepID=UPI0036CF6F14
MATAGRKPKPHLAAVREGTFRPDKHTEGARYEPRDPQEPDWSDLLPGDEDVQAKAHEVWQTVVPAVVRAAGLTDAQRHTAIEYCLTAARIWQGERVLSRDGMTVMTERGIVKHPMTTILNAYRSHFRSLTGELGLSPSSAARITPPQDGDDDGDIFD